jgi:hypothetical protein
MSFPQQDKNGDQYLSEAARLIEAFREKPTPSVLAKRDLLLRLAQLDDPHTGPHIVPFLLVVMGDRSEPNEVRIDTLRLLSDGVQLGPYRQAVADAILRLLAKGANLELRLQATLALAELTDVDGVLTTLGGLVLNSAETIDVRYAAFTSLERGGPKPASVALLRRLARDETFGRSAESMLVRWHLP